MTQPCEPGSDTALDRLPGALHATATSRDGFASGAHAGDVRQAREPEADGEHEQADAEVLVDGRDRNRDQGAGHPRDLEARLEPGEAAPSNSVGRVALEQAVEGDASRGSAGGDEQRPERRQRERRRARRGPAPHRRGGEGAGRAPTKPPTTAMIARREFAVTSSRSPPTSEGTSALRAIEYVFCITSRPNASG